MKVRFYKAAEQEFGAAIDYYEAQQPGLGELFRLAVGQALERIQQFPEAYTPLSKRTRRCLVSRFPYGVIYRPSRDIIDIVVVAHLHRKPDYWRSRTGK